MKIKKLIGKRLRKITDFVVRKTTKVNTNRVLFVSFGGKTYSDNPKFVSEALHELDPSVEILWGFQNAESKIEIVPDYVKSVNFRNMFSRYKAYYSSAVVVSNFEFPSLKKAKGQFFIQTWHGDRAFKKVLHATAFFRERLIPESIPGYCDLAIAGSEYGENQYRTAFLYNGDVLIEGTPRDDILVKNEQNEKNKILQRLNLDGTKKILLYAPTLRSDIADARGSQAISLDIKRTLESLKIKYNCEWICLVRAHPAIKALSNIVYDDSIINVNSYEDMAELLLISDMLITDYSSCAGDFALMNKPILLYQPDIDDYLETEREFYFDLNESPYYRAFSQNDVEKLINSFNDSDIEQNCKDILDFYKTNETGNASFAVAKIIVDKMSLSDN